MTGTRPRAIAFLGLGLIGGSIAKAIGASAVRPGGEPRPPICAWTPDGHGPAKALRAGVIDRAASDPAEAIEGADLVIIAAPPIATIELLGRLGADLRPALALDSLVTDVASTKGAVMDAAAAAGIRFAGGHPMAGRETAGFEGSNADLLRDRPWVVVTSPGPGIDATLQAPLRWLIDACGARPVELDAATHDAAVAAISHLPLFASVALAEAVTTGTDDWPLARSLAASGWDGMTRLARGDARMGAGIAATNAAAIAAGLRGLRAAIDGWITLLEVEHPDPGDIERRLVAVRALLDADRDGR